mmetsp:Transcript_31668/g.67282  ORF Transcript_31668/g.67282 Transcript_31668/m.67282 type:complete len:380 (-) Transcript_31668:39-1178(-)
MVLSLAAESAMALTTGPMLAGGRVPLAAVAPSVSPWPSIAGGRTRSSTCTDGRTAAVVLATSLSGLASLGLRRRRDLSRGAVIVRAAAAAAVPGHAGAVSTAPAAAGTGLSRLLSSLQGRWEDNVGHSIEVLGDEVNFFDETGLWKLEEDCYSGTISVQGALLVGGLPDLPLWRFPNGREWYWTRPDPVVLAGAAWSELFLDFKVARLLLRKSLCQAVAAEDFEAAAGLDMAWRGTWGCPRGTTPEQQVRLAAGRTLVPGAVVKHRRHGYRGVIVACEPWANAAMARRLANGGSAARLQPLYHVLVDERDTPPGFSTAAHIVPVAESDLEAHEAAFPVQGRLVNSLLVRREEIRGYLPGAPLKAAMRRQRRGMPIMLIK